MIGQKRPTPQKPVEKRRFSGDLDVSKRQKTAAASTSAVAPVPVNKELRTKAMQLLALAPLSIADVAEQLQTTKELVTPVLSEVSFFLSFFLLSSFFFFFFLFSFFFFLLEI